MDQAFAFLHQHLTDLIWFFFAIVAWRLGKRTSDSWQAHLAALANNTYLQHGLDYGYAMAQNYMRKHPEAAVKPYVLALGFLREFFEEAGKPLPDNAEMIAKAVWTAKHETDTAAGNVAPSGASGSPDPQPAAPSSKPTTSGTTPS